MKNMKGLSVLIAVVLSLSLAKHKPSDVVLTVWPPGQHYLGEPIVLTCEVKRMSSEASVVWLYTWLRPNHTTIAPSPSSSAHRVKHNMYSISALTSEDRGMYLCKAHNLDINSTLYNNSVYLNVTAASAPASLEVLPNSIQHLQGGNFSLHCSGHGGKTEDWTLRRFPGAEVNSSCLEMGGRLTLNSSDKCSFNNITARLNGLYWCKAAKGDQRSNAINITVSDHLEEENAFVATWVWVLCVIIIIIILLLITITFLLVPSLRKRVKFFPACRDFIAHQEMPRTEQDVTEIQWDLAWMEMTNLLDKPRPAS